MAFRLPPPRPQTPCGRFLQAVSAEIKQPSQSLWFGGEISLKCKMKPEHCMTSLFAYFVSFRVVVKNGTSRLESHRKQNWRPDSKFLCSVWRGLTISWIAQGPFHTADCAASHSGRFHGLTLSQVKFVTKFNVASLRSWHSFFSFFVVVLLKQCI